MRPRVNHESIPGDHVGARILNRSLKRRVRAYSSFRLRIPQMLRRPRRRPRITGDRHSVHAGAALRLLARRGIRAHIRPKRGSTMAVVSLSAYKIYRASFSCVVTCVSTRVRVIACNYARVIAVRWRSASRLSFERWLMTIMPHIGYKPAISFDHHVARPEGQVATSKSIPRWTHKWLLPRSTRSSRFIVINSFINA